MNNIKNLEYYQEIGKIISKQIFGNITKLESEKLNKWLEESQENRELYDRLLNSKIDNKLDIYNNIDSAKGLDRYYSRYNKQKFRKDSRKLIYFTRVAASLIAALSAIAIIFNITRNEPASIIEEEMIAYGNSKVTLILNDGSEMSLDDEQDKEISVANGVLIKKNDSNLSYISEDKTSLVKTDKNIINTLRTDVGGEYKLTLNDGTTIWLNSKTSLSYPVTFGDNERIVALDGEAYFEVAHDPQRPFIVRTSKGLDVRVLGTSFNVNSFKEKSSVSTVLVTGKVELDNQKNKTKLSPGEMGVYSEISNIIEISDVDTELYTSWKDGTFAFYNETIEEIFEKLSRWYNFTVEYENQKAKEERFSGSIKRRADFNLFVEVLEMSGGVDIEINKDSIYVKYKN